MADKTFEPPDWKPLEQLVGPEGCGEFMWMWGEAGIQFKCGAPHLNSNVKLPVMWSWHAKVP
jgi:hypothetical protein